MFNLDDEIRVWRRQMRAAGIKNPAVLDELESHLRDDVEQQIHSGLSAPQAFESAVQRIGQAGVIKAEFKKAGGIPHVLLRRLGASVLVALAAALVALNLFLEGESQELCMMDLVLLSLVLPLMADTMAPKAAGGAKPWVRTVWTGQLVEGVGCLMTHLLPDHPLYGLIFGMLGCLVFGRRLWRQLRVVAALTA